VKPSIEKDASMTWISSIRCSASFEKNVRKSSREGGGELNFEIFLSNTVKD